MLSEELLFLNSRGIVGTWTMRLISIPIPLKSMEVFHSLNLFWTVLDLYQISCEVQHVNILTTNSRWLLPVCVKEQTSCQIFFLPLGLNSLMCPVEVRQQHPKHCSAWADVQLATKGPISPKLLNLTLLRMVFLMLLVNLRKSVRLCLYEILNKISTDSPTCIWTLGQKVRKLAVI